MFFKRRITILLSIFIGLSSCASQPDEINYYLLHKPSAIDKAMDFSGENLVVLQSLQLADYLQSQHIVMQLNSSQLQFSSKHRWAEQLQAGLEKALLHQLRLQNSGISYLNRQQRGKASAKELFVDIKHFLITEDSKAIITGDYWFKPSGNSTQLHSFNISLNLDQDGYVHAIEKLRMLLVELAGKIDRSASKE
ncbi:ABC-type transport auxiliary lipoprotein family protein [uncultured Pseudoteredinibacter sp.]|uniref:PqiC family protein n=1 Tax=uncultured Pseudoteredinibacter sp. TaxID=1641701 RepID=UPI0026281858|nr:ABC-type transport auxiliary lipoprotein family protein [uncultured Pseudoteredinibacter sp.]